jgi:hypothetical protein
LIDLRAVLASVAGRLDAGDREGAARLYFDRIAMAPHGWDGFEPAGRAILLANAGTYHQCRDRDALGIELGSLSAFTGPALIITHPDCYIEALEGFATGEAHG